MDSNVDPGMSPMRISDAASMLRKPVSKNDRPYTHSMIVYNNSLVDEWYREVLVNIADKSGCIRAGQVWGEWNFFLQGKTIPIFMKEFEAGNIPRPNKETVNYWVKTFTELSIEKLLEMGPALVGHAWKIINDEIFISQTLEKWEKVYEEDPEDPMLWRKNAHNNPKLWAEDFENPFWGKEELTDVTQKVSTILKVNVTPNNRVKIPDSDKPMKIDVILMTLTSRIEKNELPYTRIVKEYNNEKVKEWYNGVLKKIANKSGQILVKQIWPAWQIYSEGEILPQFVKGIENGHVLPPSEKCVNYWINFLSKSTIEELAPVGTELVAYAWKLISDDRFIKNAVLKVNKVYNDSDSILSSHNRAFANKNLWSEEQNISWEKDEMEDVVQKFNSIVKIRVSPN